MLERKTSAMPRELHPKELAQSRIQVSHFSNGGK
jgi:hypothetical protein